MICPVMSHKKEYVSCETEHCAMFDDVHGHCVFLTIAEALGDIELELAIHDAREAANEASQAKETTRA